MRLSPFPNLHGIFVPDSYPEFDACERSTSWRMRSSLGITQTCSHTLWCKWGNCINPKLLVFILPTQAKIIIMRSLWAEIYTVSGIGRTFWRKVKPDRSSLYKGHRTDTTRAFSHSVRLSGQRSATEESQQFIFSIPGQINLWDSYHHVIDRLSKFA